MAEAGDDRPGERGTTSPRFKFAHESHQLPLVHRSLAICPNQARDLTLNSILRHQLFLLVRDCFVHGFKVGNSCAVRYEELDGREPHGDLTVSFKGREDGGGLLLILLALWSLWTQYAIALELRLAYCGLQDANFDLLVSDFRPMTFRGARVPFR